MICNEAVKQYLRLPGKTKPVWARPVLTVVCRARPSSSPACPACCPSPTTRWGTATLSSEWVESARSKLALPVLYKLPWPWIVEKKKDSSYTPFPSTYRLDKLYWLSGSVSRALAAIKVLLPRNLATLLQVTWYNNWHACFQWCWQPGLPAGSGGQCCGPSLQLPPSHVLYYLPPTLTCRMWTKLFHSSDNCRTCR